ncbi:GWxTD domain-containing protein [bacterium]|nr:MAG: GWxTD domain-containing protein [bacterium]
MRLFPWYLALLSVLSYGFTKSSAIASEIVIQRAINAQMDVQDSSLYYKKLAFTELKNYENMSGALRIFSKLFGDNLKRSSQYISKVLKNNAEDTEGIFLKGMLQRFEGKLRESEASFKQVISKDDRFVAFDLPNVWLQLGSTYREMGEYDLAIDSYKQGALINLEDTFPLIQLSLVFMDIGKDEEACEAFYGGLNDIRDPVTIEKVFIDAKEIASTDEIKQWESFKSNPEKLEFLKTFWKRRDPNPIDPVNQRLIEHYKRLNYARQTYSKAFKPWYDDRGALYIKLGKPERVYYGRPQQNIKENESWFYDNIKAGLFYDFVDFHGSYQLTSLFDAVDHSAKIQDIVELFNERSSYNMYYQKIALKIKTQADVEQQRIEEQMQNAGGGLTGIGPLIDRLSRARDAAGALQTNQNLQDNTFNLNYVNKQNFIFDVGAPHLPINCNFASFKGNKKDSRLEFYYVVPFNQLNFVPSISETNKFSTGLKLNFALFDLKYDEVMKLDRDYMITAGGNEITSHFYIDQLDNEIPPGKYVAALEIRNNEKDRVGIYQFVVSVRDYSSDTLTVSDIEIAQYVDNTITREKFVKPKSTLKVVPNPAAGLLKNKPLTVYYEIYNLTLNNDGKSSYQISYSIKMAEGGQGFLKAITGVFGNKQEASTSSITTKEGKSTTEKEYIGFDISELPTGVATLEVKVKDLNSSKESSSVINLTILDEEKKKEETIQK